MQRMMQNEIVNGSGWFSTYAAVFLNVNSWLNQIHFNQALTVLISLLSVVFLFMKIYDQYLVTKERKNK